MNKAHLKRESIESFLIWIEHVVDLLWYCLTDLSWERIWWTFRDTDQFDRATRGENPSDLLWCGLINGWLYHKWESNGPIICMRCDSMTTPSWLGIWWSHHKRDFTAWWDYFVVKMVYLYYTFIWSIAIGLLILYIDLMMDKLCDAFPNPNCR